MFLFSFYVVIFQFWFACIRLTCRLYLISLRIFNLLYFSVLYFLHANAKFPEVRQNISYTEARNHVAMCPHILPSPTIMLHIVEGKRGKGISKIRFLVSRVAAILNHEGERENERKEGRGTFMPKNRIDWKRMVARQRAELGSRSGGDEGEVEEGRGATRENNPRGRI